LADNSYGPFAAVLEGLDYLACLTSAANLAKIQAGFERWLSKTTTTVPDEFQGVSPSATARHEVIVLAPGDYYGLYSRSVRGSGWQSLASLPVSSPVLSIRFGVSEFASSTGMWAAG
jgi:hypothetical protein